MFQLGLRPRLLFRYSLFLLGKNGDGYSNILYFYMEKLGLLFRFTLFLPGVRPRLLFRYPLFLLDTKLILLFRYPLFLPSLRPRLLFRYPLYLPDNKSGLLFRHTLLLPGLRPRLLFKYPLFLLVKNLTAIQISYVSSQPTTKIAIHVSSVSN